MLEWKTNKDILITHSYFVNTFIVIEFSVCFAASFGIRARRWLGEEEEEQEQVLLKCVGICKTSKDE